jgi:hypothetical protein
MKKCGLRDCRDNQNFYDRILKKEKQHANTNLFDTEVIGAEVYKKTIDAENRG